MKKVLLFNYLAEPSVKNLKETCGGAYINCWVDFSDREGAEVLAKYYIEKSGWKIIKEVEKAVLVDGSNYKKNAVKRNFYDMAIRDGLCFACFTWPVDTPQPECPSD
jgi:hypothetical protein